MLRVLLWKDCRVQRVALVAAFCVIVVPYGYATYQYIGDRATVVPSTTVLRASLEHAGSISLMASLIVVSMLAGGAFAAERSDRSDEFLALLPTARFMILGSKAVVVMVTTSVLWLLNPYVIMRIASVFTVDSTLPPGSGDPTLGTVSAMAISVLGTGWLGSILVANPASSLLIGLLSPFFSLLLAYGICG